MPKVLDELSGIAREPAPSGSGGRQRLRTERRLRCTRSTRQVRSARRSAARAAAARRRGRRRRTVRAVRSSQLHLARRHRRQPAAPPRVVDRARPGAGEARRTRARRRADAFRYPDGAATPSLVVDPRDATPYVITRVGRRTRRRSTGSTTSASPAADRRADRRAARARCARASRDGRRRAPDGERVLLRTYTAAWEFSASRRELARRRVPRKAGGGHRRRSSSPRHRLRTRRTVVHARVRGRGQRLPDRLRGRRHLPRQRRNAD